MLDRWRGRTAGLAIAAILAGSLGVAALASADGAAPTLVVADGAGRVLARVTLPADRTFSLRCRNSLYGSLAEERFVVAADGRMQLVGLASDEMAVLEEYYAVDEAPAPAAAGDPRVWQAPPAREVVLEELTIAATQLGERTLLVAGAEPVELWRLVDAEEPSVVLRFERERP